MSKDMPLSQGRIAFALWYPRHIYWNWLAVCLEVKKLNGDITIISHRQDIVDKAREHGLSAKLVAPKLESAWARFGLIGRILSWIWAWVVVPLAVQEFSLVILPNENIPQNRIITLTKSSLVCSFALGNFDKAFIFRYYRPAGKNYENIFRDKISSFNRDCIDYFFGIGFRSWRPQPNSRKHYSLIGNLQCEYLSSFDIDRSQMVVTGTPNLDNLLGDCKAESSLFKKIPALDPSSFIVSIFPSSLTLDQDVLEDILNHMRFLHVSETSLHVVFKLHPRFDDSSAPNLEELSRLERFKITFVTTEFNDKENATLISISDKVLISGGNIGMICCLLKKGFYYFESGESLPDIWAVSDIGRPLNEIACEAVDLTKCDFSPIAFPEACPSKKIAEYALSLISDKNVGQN